MLKNLKFIAACICLFLAIVWIFRSATGSDSAGKHSTVPVGNHPAGLRRESRAAPHRDPPRLESNEPPAPRALELPLPTVDGENLKASIQEGRASAISHGSAVSDDDILTRGGVLPVIAKASMAGDKAKDPRSIKSQDWKGAANLLVNALRAGDRFEIDHDQLMDFLRGKDLLGWPESYRNWIGDELMTALRQDLPKSAFEDLKSIVADSTAPAAMRDYSVQHISHLVTGGVIGKEGAEYIWQTLEKNDPQTLSTALISLHRLSEQVPDLVHAQVVQAAAERLKESPDERTRITADSILRTSR